MINPEYPLYVEWSTPQGLKRTPGVRPWAFKLALSDAKEVEELTGKVVKIIDGRTHTTLYQTYDGILYTPKESKEHM